MSLSSIFNDDYRAEKVNSNVLSVRYIIAGYPQLYAFDFAARVMVTRTDGYGDAGAVVTPFSQLDPDMLIDFRDKLVELGGTPPPLSASTPATPSADKKFRL